MILYSCLIKPAESLSDEERTSFLNTSHDELANAIKVAFEDMDKIDETTYKEVATKTPNPKVLDNIRTGLMAGATAISRAKKDSEMAGNCESALAQ